MTGSDLFGDNYQQLIFFFFEITLKLRTSNNYNIFFLMNFVTFLVLTFISVQKNFKLLRLLCFCDVFNFLVLLHFYVKLIYLSLKKKIAKCSSVFNLKTCQPTARKFYTTISYLSFLFYRLFGHIRTG